jgi:hypothetical protein
MPKIFVSDNKINAAFDVVKRDLTEIIEEYIPPFFQPNVFQKLQEPETIRRICKVIDDAIEAAEKA